MTTLASMPYPTARDAALSAHAEPGTAHRRPSRRLWYIEEGSEAIPVVRARTCV